MNTATTISFWMTVGMINVAVLNTHAEEIYYRLDNVTLEENTQMTGLFSWTYDTNDFENGVGQFIALSIPHTAHDQDDLDASFDIGKSIEITLAGSVHDDGVDITLVLDQPLTPTTSSRVNLIESKYEIGGNGFHSGWFQNGRISPTNVVLSITNTSPDVATISWEPDIPGYMLQETLDLIVTNWMNASSGSTNPVGVPTTAQRTFFRLKKP